jgi:hypothetical protein
MSPVTAASAGQAASLLLHLGYVQAADAALAAIAALCAVAVLLTRKRITWSARLDVPVGFTPGPSAAGTGPAGTIEFGDDDPWDADPHPPGTGQAWLVILAITNPGLIPVRSEDFRTPLTFTFPGRQVHTAQVRASPRTSNRCLVPAAGAAPTGPGQPSDQAAIQLQGRFRLSRNEELTLLAVLSGTPAPASPRIRQEGSLTGGKIVANLAD